MPTLDQHYGSEELFHFRWFVLISDFVANQESVLEEPARSVTFLFPPESKDEFQIIFVAVERNIALQELLYPDTLVQKICCSSTYKSYSYVMNNPIMYVDPSGYMGKDKISYDDDIDLETQMEDIPFYRGSYSMGDPFFNLWDVYHHLNGTSYGGTWSPNGGYSYFGSSSDASNAINKYHTYHNSLEYSDQSISRTVLGTDLYGNQEVLLEDNRTGKLSILKVPFWEITGSYFNTRYYYEGVAAYGDPNDPAVGAIDWRGVGNATLFMAGGIAEMIVGGAVEFFSVGASTPLTVPMMIEGAGRTVANAQRLTMYLNGNSKIADAYPTSLGAAIGKFGDLANGVPMDQIGNGQAICGTVNDFTAFVASGGSGYAIQNAVMYPSMGNWTFYGFTVGNYTYSMYENGKGIQ